MISCWGIQRKEKRNTALKNKISIYLKYPRMGLLKPFLRLLQSCLQFDMYAGKSAMDDFRNLREMMVREQIASRGIRDQRVLDAMLSVERHLFVPEHLRNSAYDDNPLPLGYGQTISQPYIVALMTELCALTGTERVLEIGTGSGYQTAILAECAEQVYSMERLEILSETAVMRLSRLGYTNIHLRAANGYRGWKEEAPFDVIMLTAAPEEIPDALIEQLREGGRIIAPVGTGMQELILGTRHDGVLSREKIIYVRFVPML
jgi:protein-L-isoaspartate(D-aspartate) O-methyltransferase